MPASPPSSKGLFAQYLRCREAIVITIWADGRKRTPGNSAVRPLPLTNSSGLFPARGQCCSAIRRKGKTLGMPGASAQMNIQKRPRLRLPQKQYGLLHRAVLERDGWRCQRCGSLIGLEVHHITSRSQLGDDADENLITLCWKCHRQIHSLQRGQTKVPLPLRS